MNTPIFRAFAVPLTALMLIASLFILLRGHNAPGGGFIGGLVAAAAFALQAVKVSPLSVAAFGLSAACVAGLFSALAGMPFMTGLWIEPHLFGITVPLSTVMLFDAGVYLVVVGAVTAIALAVEEEEP